VRSDHFLGEAKPCGPLAHLRVIEVGSIIAGPFATRLLGDYGADVIKVESPRRPDPMREWGRQYRGRHLWWLSHARNKRCVTLDLTTPVGQELFVDLAGHADVIVENFRPGTLESWGLSYGRLQVDNPGLILARVSGYGQTGPYHRRPGYASVAEALGGLRAVNGYPNEAPPRMAVSLGDSLAAMFAVIGVLAALQDREVTGRGQVVDVALSESVLALTESIISEYDRLGVVRGPSGTRLDGIAPSNLYRTKDDAWVIVAANQDTVFARLCVAMGREDLVDDPRFGTHQARGEHQDEIDQIVAGWVATQTADDASATLEAPDVAVGPVYTAPEIIADPQFLARDMLVPHYDDELGEAVLAPGVVPKFSASTARVRWAGPPRPGSHNEEVFGQLLGLEPNELARLRAEGVL
jgi:formyl-CoA transferase